MAPRTRSGRMEKLEAEKLLKSGLANISGLPVVPPEILLAIVSHLYYIPVPSQPLFWRYIPTQCLERSKTLQSLSQTCRSLRNVTLPIMWQKIEVSVERHEGKDKTYDKRLATELVRQLEIVTVRDPTLAQYVQEVSICLSTCSMATVFPELVRALHMFPNMHSLQIISPVPLVQLKLIDAFEGHTFPTVRQLALNGAIYSLVKSFPRVQVFYTHNYFINHYLWREVVQHWEGITKVQGLFVPDRCVLEKVTAKLRNLKYLEVNADDLLLKSDGAIDLMPTTELLQRLEVLKFAISKQATSEEYSRVRRNVQPLLAEIQKVLGVMSKDKVVIIEFGCAPSFTEMPCHVGRCKELYYVLQP